MKFSGLMFKKVQMERVWVSGELPPIRQLLSDNWRLHHLSANEEPMRSDRLRIYRLSQHPRV